MVGGPAPMGKEDGRGPAGAGLPMRKGCPSYPDPSDVPHPGGGLSRVGWALEGITAATRGEAEAPVTEGAASHMGLEAESTDGDGTSGTEDEGSTTTGTGGETTDSDSSSDGSSLAVADTSVPTPAAGYRKILNLGRSSVTPDKSTGAEIERSRGLFSFDSLRCESRASTAFTISRSVGCHTASIGFQHDGIMCCDSGQRGLLGDTHRNAYNVSYVTTLQRQIARSRRASCVFHRAGDCRNERNII
ncbi:hypothetical protein NDU88_006996 [Pleurodeles waltl]|uniref:Uncharacterized protein n=1 Tax=Pleurodeles waltl TaxID=8319 RepID=A0AAV7NUZ4_PLEWA|nr:hypothetical protein NDU88_006996 [Pleurodeles waltl]